MVSSAGTMPSIMFQRICSNQQNKCLASCSKEFAQINNLTRDIMDKVWYFMVPAWYHNVCLCCMSMAICYMSNEVVCTYVARSRQHGNGYDTWTRGKFLKIHTARVSDTRVRHVSDTTRLHDRSVRATLVCTWLSTVNVIPIWVRVKVNMCWELFIFLSLDYISFMLEKLYKEDGSAGQRYDNWFWRGHALSIPWNHTHIGRLIHNVWITGTFNKQFSCCLFMVSYAELPFILSFMIRIGCYIISSVYWVVPSDIFEVLETSVIDTFMIQ